MKRASVSQNRPGTATGEPPQNAPWFLFAPGAGAPSTSPWMESWRERLSVVGRVVTFDYPYQKAGRARPDPLPVLLRAHKDALEGGRLELGDRVWLTGKSMGSRVGCQLASETPCDGVICFGYPLVSPSGVTRSETLLTCAAPLLLIQGTRDRLTPLAKLRDTLEKRSAPTVLAIVPSGDHSLVPLRSNLRETGQTDDSIHRAILAEVQRFMTETERPPYREVQLGEDQSDASLAERSEHPIPDHVRDTIP